MTLYYPKITMTIPRILVNQDQEELPLGRYGCELLKYMKNNDTDRYWELNFSGSLMQTIHKREIELMDLKLTLMEDLEKNFPRPKTGSLIELASHMDIIDEQAEAEIAKILFQPI